MTQSAWRSALLALAAALFASVSLAKAPQPTVLPPVGVELVQLDAIVTDGAGKAVTDLGLANFELYVDGRKEAITHFALGSASRAVRFVPGSQEAVPVRGVKGRYLVFFIDDYTMSFDRFAKVRASLARFISDLDPEDQVAVVTASGSQGPLGQFTSDRKVLSRALSRLGLNYMDTHFSGSIASRQPGLLWVSLSRLLALNSELAALPVRKLVFLVSDGGTPSFYPFPAELVRGWPSELGPVPATQTEALTRLTDSAFRYGVTIYSIDSRGLEVSTMAPDGGGARGYSRADAASDAARSSRPPIGDASARQFPDTASGGVLIEPGAAARNAPATVRPFNPAAYANDQSIPRYLAQQTGGNFFANQNNYGPGLQKTLAQNETYYILGFSPASAKSDSAARRIDVKVVGRKGVKVWSRKGYLQQRPAALQTTVVSGSAAMAQRAAQALSAVAPPQGITTDLKADFVQTPEGPAVQLLATMGPEGIALRDNEGRREAEIGLFGYVYDEQGRPVADLAHRLGLSLEGERLASFEQDGLKYAKLVPLKPGFYYVRVAVLTDDEHGPVGSAGRWVEIPAEPQAAIGRP